LAQAQKDVLSLGFGTVLGGGGRLQGLALVADEAFHSLIPLQLAASLLFGVVLYKE